MLDGLLAVRRPLYEEIADFSVDTTGRQVRAVASDVRALLEARA